MRHAGQVVSKETLSIEALDRKLAKFDRSIDVHIPVSATNGRRFIDPTVRGWAICCQKLIRKPMLR